jgi:hypothetical protein
VAVKMVEVDCASLQALRDANATDDVLIIV